MKTLILKNTLKAGLVSLLVLVSAFVMVARPVLAESDTVAPTVHILSPTNGAVISKNTPVTITQEAYDNVGVTRLVYKVKGVTVCDGLQADCWFAPTRSGIYSISVTAYDAAGNYSMDLISVTVK